MLENLAFLLGSSYCFFLGLGGLEGLISFFFMLDCPKGSNYKGIFCTSGEGLSDSLPPSFELIVWFRRNSMSGVAEAGILTFSSEVSFSKMF